MSRRAIVALVAEVGPPEAGFHTESITLAEPAPAGARLTLREKDGTMWTRTIPRDPYFELHSDIIEERRGKPVYVESKESDERVASRILIPQRRKIEEVNAGRFHVDVRAKGSPLRLLLAPDRKEEIHRLQAAKEKGEELLITHDPETHEILDVRDPFEPGRGGVAPRKAVRASPEPLSFSQAIEAFNHLARACEIPFDYPDEYCNARAHEMYRLLREVKIPCEKIWNYGGEGKQVDSRIRIFTLRHPDGLLFWGFHVAIVVKVRLPKRELIAIDLVFDPSLAAWPLRIPDWVALQHDSSAIQERTPPEVFHQLAGGQGREFDSNFVETAATLRRARCESRRRELDLWRGEARAGQRPWPRRR